MRNAQSSLALDVRSDGPTVVVHLDGELDITSSPLLLTVIEQVVAARRVPRCDTLVVEMNGVGFADASGLSPLLMARAVLSRRGGTIELRRCRRPVRRLLRILGLEDMLGADAPRAG